MKKIVIFSLGLLFLGTMVSSSATPPAVNKGDQAPDFELKSPAGKKVSLKKLKGKMVLIDFWASWCGPCRRENPNVVEAYNKYHKSKFKNGKGFEVLSVSLDRQEAPWLKAIEDDKLVWKNHGWDNEGKVSSMYGVRSIPTAFLVDGDGKVIAKGAEIRGMKLHLVLDEQLKD